jgi:transposase
MDLAKRVFHVVEMDETGHIVLKKRLTREALLPFIAQLPPLVMGMEACGGAPYWARRFREHGHTPAAPGSPVCAALRQSK